MCYITVTVMDGELRCVSNVCAECVVSECMCMCVFVSSCMYVCVCVSVCVSLVWL